MQMTKSPAKRPVARFVSKAQAIDKRLGDWLTAKIEQRVLPNRLTFLRPYADGLRHRIATLRQLPESRFGEDQQASEVVKSYDRQVAYAAYRRDWKIHQANRFLSRFPFPIFLLLAYLLLGRSPQLSLQVVGLIGLVCSLPIALLVYALNRRALFRLNRNRILGFRQQTNDLLTGLLILIQMWFAFELGRWHLSSPRWITAGVTLGLLGSATDVAIWLVKLLHSEFRHYTWITEGFNRAPDAVMVSHLITAVVTVAGSSERLRWNNLRLRRSILYDIEMCARCIDYYLPNALRPYDHDTWTWQTTEARRIAGSVRKLKVLLILPAQDSKERFLQKSLAALYAIATGDWNALERIDVSDFPPQARRITLRQRMLVLLAAIARALVPLILAIVATQVNLGSMDGPLISGSIANYLLGVTALYAAVAIVMAIDPQLAERVRTAREILGMIPTREGSHEEGKDKDLQQ
jgi:hypothetical protein